MWLDQAMCDGHPQGDAPTADQQAKYLPMSLKEEEVQPPVAHVQEDTLGAHL